MPQARTRVVVTGMGAVSPYGWGLSPLRAGLRSGETAIGDFHRFDHAAHRTHLAGEVPGGGALTGLDRRTRRRITWSERFALSAAREAWAHAGLGRAGPRPFGVFFGSSTGGMFEGEAFFAHQRRFGASHLRASMIVSQQNNAPGDAVARDLELTGPVETVSAACASGAMSIAHAVDALREGEIEVALAGGSDSLCRLTYAGFNSLRSVDAEPTRPFRAGRAGLNIGEGAGVVVLETGAHASARGARPLAEAAGVGLSCDAHHMTAPHPEGDGIARAAEAALADAGLAPDDIDFVNAHGTGTPHNDAAESLALRRLFEGRPVPVVATKGHVGHLLGAAGALEAVATILALSGGELPPTPGEEPADPELGVDLVRGAPRPIPDCRAALSTSLAFGGANAALVLTRPTGEVAR